MTGERPGTSDLGQNYRNYSRTIFVPGLEEIRRQFQDPGHVLDLGSLRAYNVDAFSLLNIFFGNIYI